MKNRLFNNKYGLLAAGEKYGGENYLTEVWAWILQNDQIFLTAYIKELFDVSLPGEKFEVKTQKHTKTDLAQGFIDLVVTTTSFCFIFEHKIYHTFGEDQILKYIKWAKDSGYSQDKILSATVSGYSIDHSSTAKDSSMIIVNYLWHDVYKFISDHLDSNVSSEIEAFSLRCFQNILIKKELTWEEREVSMEGLKNYYAALEVNLSLRDTFQNIKEHYSWKKVYDVFQRVGDKKRPPKTPIERWGRIGIDLERERGWSPSIFFGALVDPRDHKVRPSDTKLGPDLCLIIDLDHKRYSDYDTLDSYKNLKLDMQKLAKHLGNGWEFYDHLEKDAGNVNFWHPLYLRKPLYNVIEGANTPELQHNRIEIEMRLLFEGILEKTCFLKFKSALINQN